MKEICKKLAVEMYQVKNKMSPLPVQELFKFRGNSAQNIRNNREREVRRVRTVNNGTESIRYRGLSTMGPNL